MAAPTHRKEPNRHGAQIGGSKNSANGSRVVRSKDPRSWRPSKQRKYDHGLTRTAGDGSLSFTPQLAERSSPSRVRCAAQTQRVLDGSGLFYGLTVMKEREPMINALTTRAPPVGRRSTILGGGIFDRNYGEFSTGVDTPSAPRAIG